MESLYRKYRPQTFSDVVGQTHVVSTLEHAVLEGRVSHAYLFCGPRGTGKTTMARILAKSLLCETGQDHLPDGTCEQCLAVAEGNHPDVYELDAASRTGVDSVREEIINSVGYAPVRGRSKIYIIDEVHMLTNQAFNALLKTLEEPPGHVTFVMCTTDPQMIPETILSRVQRFDFKSISTEDIRNHLAYICDKEGFTYNDQALDLVVRHARGGMRDALSSLEQLSVFGNCTIALEDALDMLGVSSSSQMHDISMALAQRDGARLFELIDQMINGGADLLHFTRQLCVHMRNVYVYQVAQGNQGLLSSIPQDINEIADEAESFGSHDRVSYIISLLSKTASEMRHSPNQRLNLESCMVRLTRPDADLTLEALAARIADLEQQLAELQSRPAVVQQVQVAPQGAQMPSSSIAEIGSLGVAPLGDIMNAPSSSPTPQPIASQATSSSINSDVIATNPDQWEYLWKEVMRELSAQKPFIAQLLKGSHIGGDDGEVLRVSLPAGSAFAIRALPRQDIAKCVIPVVRKSFGNRQISYVEDVAGTAKLKAQKVAAAPASESTAGAETPEPRHEIQERRPEAYEEQYQEPAPQPSVYEKSAPAPAGEGELPPWEDPSLGYEDAPSYDETYEIEQDIPAHQVEQSVVESVDKLDLTSLSEEEKDIYEMVSEAFGEGVSVFKPQVDAENPPFEV